jgi:hypothetical protein
MNIFRFVSFLVFSIALAVTALAQATLPESPESAPVAQPEPVLFLGLELGAQAALAGGSFTAPCNCTYQSGNMMAAPAVGMFVEKVYAPGLHVSAAVRYGGYNFDYIEDATLHVFTPAGDPLELPIERKASVRTAYLSLGVDAKWYPGIARLYVSAGPEFGYFLRGTIKDEETILMSGFVYPDHTNHRVYADQDMKDVYKVRSLRMAARIAAGIDLPLSRAVYVSPEAGYVFAVTSVASDQSSWKLSALQGLVRVKFAL